jgi:hypothetical protein
MRQFLVTDAKLVELTSGIKKLNPVQITGTGSNEDEEVFEIQSAARILTAQRVSVSSCREI